MLIGIDVFYPQGLKFFVFCFSAGSPEFACLLGECLISGGGELRRHACGGRLGGGGFTSRVGDETHAVQVLAFVALCTLIIPRGPAQVLFLLRHEISPLFPQWRYCIRLENLDSDVVQLRERHWRIFSLSGTLETVRGRGVVGRVSIFGLIILVSGPTQQAWELGAWSPPLWLGTEVKCVKAQDCSE